MNKPNLLECLLGLFFLAILHCSFVKAQSPCFACVTNTLTVIKILPPEKGDTVTRIIFATSQRIYKLPLKARHAYMRRLNESLKDHIPVLITRASEGSDVIVRVEKVRRK